MKEAKKFLKAKGLKDTLYDVKKDNNTWKKGGLSALLDEYADSKVKNFSFNLSVMQSLSLRTSQITNLATIGTNYVVSPGFGEDKPFLTEKGVSEIIAAYEKMRSGNVA